MATEAHIYLDESGDTGWSFILPYTRGGSSRYLVIAASLLSPEVVAKPERVVRQLYTHRRWKTDSEKKWVHMSPAARSAFATTAAKLLRELTEVRLMAIVVDKTKIDPHIHSDPTTLYNYMVKRLLLSAMAKYDRVHFRPDPRTLRVSRTHSLHDYLQTELWFEAGTNSRLDTIALDSRSSLNLQFIDMVSGAIHSYFEFGESRHWAPLEPYVRLEKWNFGLAAV